MVAFAADANYEYLRKLDDVIESVGDKLSEVSKQCTFDQFDWDVIGELNLNGKHRKHVRKWWGHEAGYFASCDVRPATKIESKGLHNTNT